MLLDWNLDSKDGEPLEPNEASMLAIPESLGFMLLNAWLDELAGVPSPLGDESSDGAGVSIPQVPLGSPSS